LASCDFLWDFIEDSIIDLEPLGENEFYAQDIQTSKYYKLKAENAQQAIIAMFG
jgi:hypothetical protein